ncbi:hypothetical protein [Nocardia sp. NPDC004260]
MIFELVERLRGATKGVADADAYPLRQSAHGLRRVSGVGQTDEEIAQRFRGVDSRARDRDLINDLDYHTLYVEAQRFDGSDPRVAKEVRRLGRVGRGDPALAQILRRQGFDGLPRLVDAEGMREAVEGGWTEMSRGVRRLQDVEEFKTADSFVPGRGGYGSGTYVFGREPGKNEPDSAHLREMAKDWSGDPTGADPGGVIHMAMHPEALTTDLRSLTAQRDAELASIDAELRQAPERSARRTELDERKNVLSDVGRYAASRGYDAYRINDMYVWVVLNRTALIVER